MTYTKHAMRRTFALIIFTGLSSLFAYGLRVTLARSLTPAQYGLFWSVYSLIFFFNFIADLGLGSAVVKLIPELQVEQRFDQIKGIILHTMKVQTMIAIPGALIFVLLAPWLSTYYFHTPEARMMVYILAATFALFPLNTLLNALHGFQNIFAYAVVSAAKNGIALLVTLILLSLEFGHLAPAYGYLASYLILPILSLYGLATVNFKGFRTVKASIDPGLKKRLLWFGFPIMLTTLGSTIIGYTDTLTLTYFRSLEEVGLYNTALPLAMSLWLAVSSINAVILPMSSEMWARGHKKSLQSGIILVYRYLLIALVPAALLLMAFPEIVLTLLFGQKYSAAALALQILSGGALVGSVAILNNSILSGIGHPKLVSQFMAGAVGANLLGNILLIPLWGIEGAAIATALSFSLLFIASMVSLERLVEVKIPLRFWASLALGTGVFVVVIETCKQLLDLHPFAEAVITLTVAGIAYGAIALLTRTISISETKSLMREVLK